VAGSCEYDNEPSGSVKDVEVTSAAAGDPVDLFRLII
jgi:hypothetical protein